MVSIGVEEWVLFWLIEVENVGLVQQKDGCNFIENSAIMSTISLKNQLECLGQRGFRWDKTQEINP
jgi:hypothetical protein